jgi:hypothetical protein
MKAGNFILLAITVLTNLAVSAQQLIPGTFPSTSESLLAVRYRNVRNVNSNQAQANFTGIPDLGSNRNNGTRSEQSLNYSNTGSYSFSITYNMAANTIVSVTTINGTTTSNTLSDVSSRLSADGKTRSAAAINLIRLSVRTQTGNSTISISNLRIDGLSVNGNYGRSNNGGVSEWYATSNLLNNGFTISGTVSLSGNFSNSAEGQRIEFTFGHTTQSNAGLLPLGLEDFKVQRTGQGANLLQWNTLYENNTSHFEIQRSADDQNYTTIGTVNASGESTTLRSYNYTDRTAGSGTWYYRLLAKDKDGQQSFSSIVKVKGNTERLASSLMKVSSSQLRLEFYQNANRVIRILDMSGRVQYQMQSKEQMLHIPVTSLISGNYVVHITDADGTSETKRFVK